MTSKSCLTILFLFTVALTITGCGGMNMWLSTARNSSVGEAAAAMNDEVSADTTVFPADSISTDVESTVEDAEWLKLTNQEKLDSIAILLNMAVSRREEGDYTVAEFYFHSAREKIDDVDQFADEIDREDYLRLANEIDLLYRDFVIGLDTIPAGSSPDAVLMGIEYADGDSNGVNGLFLEKPEVSFDSSEMDSVLDLKVKLPPVPVVMNRKVEDAIRFFQNKGRKVFTVWLSRSEYNVPLMQKILREEGLPEELVYLSMIESGFNPKAYSYAHAAGPWQFIRSTGRIFGLDSDWWYDERRDPVKSTIAACKYLKKLYLDFEDWYLALAAYNCGEARVQRHIQRYDSRDFWNLRKLPRQTRSYVPTYIAAMIIAHNPAEYGFEEVVFKNPPPYDSVMIYECIDLTLIAEILDTSYAAVKDMNPAIVRWCTPPTQDSVWLKIPVGSREKLEEGISAIPENQKRSWVRHRVRSGETLSSIARKYNTSMKAIRDITANRITSYHKISAGQTLLIPVPPGRHSYDWAEYNQSESSNRYIPAESPGDRQMVTYAVRRGDNLSTIAEKYHTSVGALRRWNKLWGKRFIYPGQKLVIYTPIDDVAEAKTPASAGGNVIKGKVHTVRYGESLWLIARKYGVSVESLKNLNGLSGDCVIHSGDRIKLSEEEESEAKFFDLSLVKNAEASESKPVIYIVKKGDTLWDISRTFGVPLSEIKKYNGLTSRSVIKPGEKLLIPVK